MLKSASELGKRKRTKAKDFMDPDEAEINLHQAFGNRLTSIVRIEFESMLRDDYALGHSVHAGDPLTTPYRDLEKVSLAMVYCRTGVVFF